MEPLGARAQQEGRHKAYHCVNAGGVNGKSLSVCTIPQSRKPASQLSTVTVSPSPIDPLDADKRLVKKARTFF
jgi:hypothetical protein